MVICICDFVASSFLVELNASERAKKEIQKLNLAMEKEEQGVAHMLIAAASTYVEGVLSSAL